DGPHGVLAESLEQLVRAEPRTDGFADRVCVGTGFLFREDESSLAGITARLQIHRVTHRDDRLLQEAARPGVDIKKGLYRTALTGCGWNGHLGWARCWGWHEQAHR